MHIPSRSNTLYQSNAAILILQSFLYPINVQSLSTVALIFAPRYTSKSAMALLLYRKFFKKKTPESFELCVHQQELNIIRPSEQDDPSHLPFHGSGLPTNQTFEKSLRQPRNSKITPIGPCTRCKVEERAANVYRWKLIVGLFFPFSVQALDTTMIAGALPFIASDFRK